MKGKSLVPAILLLLTITVAHASEHRPLNCTQLVSWVLGGVPEARLSQLVEQRGISFAPGAECTDTLRAAGAHAALLQNLQKAHQVAPSQSNGVCPAGLVQAVSLMRDQHYREAERELRNALRADPGNGALHFALGSVLRKEESWEGALDEYTESARLMRDVPETHNRMSYLFFKMGDPENAVAEARTALSMDPRNAEAYKVLGLGLSAGGQYDAALHAFEESLVRQPDSPDVYQNMGITFREKGDLVRAAGAYRKALQLRPNFWEAHNNLGMVLREQHKYPEAIAEYREAKRLAPDQPAIRNNLGGTYCDIEDYDAAIAEFRELFRMDPSWTGGHNCMAKALMAKRQYDDAISELRLAVRENPTGAAEHRVLGQALLLTHKNPDALRELRIAVQLNPDSALAHHYLAVALESNQDYAAALVEHREAIRLEPTADNHYYLAVSLINKGNYDEALQELETAAQMNPSQRMYRTRKDELLKQMKANQTR